MKKLTAWSLGLALMFGMSLPGCEPQPGDQPGEGRPTGTETDRHDDGMGQPAHDQDTLDRRGENGVGADQPQRDATGVGQDQEETTPQDGQPGTAPQGGQNQDTDL